MESTGHYSLSLLHFLKSLNFEVSVFNPLSVSMKRKSESLRKTKTDKCDARHIARLLVAGSSKPYYEQSYHIQRLKSLTRARFRLTSEITPLKNRFKRLVHMLSPEIQGFFSPLYSPTALTLLATLPGANAICDCNALKLTKLLAQASHGKIKRAKADELKALAKNSIACGTSGDSFELKLAAERIMFLLKQQELLDFEIESAMNDLNSPITTIRGIGNVLGAIILAEIGDINLFATPAKLLAFAGCEPNTYESGKYVASKTPMVKRGSKYLRRALYLATDMAFVHNKTFRDYINKKRTEGKHFYTAMSHGMRKLVRIIFAVLTKNTPFIESV
jgi:transposase